MQPWPEMPEEPGFFFHVEDVSMPLPDEHPPGNWLGSVILEENRIPGEINIIFCSDAYLLELNQHYLQHDTLTDIITFPNEGPRVAGDIFISAERVRENAAVFGVSFEQELDRVMVHGVLHLCGHDDTSPEQKAAMRSREDHYLAKR